MIIFIPNQMSPRFACLELAFPWTEWVACLSRANSEIKPWSTVGVLSMKIATESVELYAGD